MNTRKPRLDKFEQPDFIARLCAGDETAYHEVVEELAVWFAVYTKRKFGINEEDVKDIVQDAIMTVYLKIAYRGSRSDSAIAWSLSTVYRLNAFGRIGKLYHANYATQDTRHFSQFEIPRFGKITDRNSANKLTRQRMEKKHKQDLKAFEEYLRHLVKTSPYRPFTTEEIEQILTSYGKPKNLKKYRNEKLVDLMKEAHLQKQARAEACFREPSKVHSLGELLNSILVIKRVFISQLAQELEMTAEEIEDHIENRQPTRSWREDQMQKLAVLTGIAIEEVRRIAGQTANTVEMKTRAAVESAPKPAPRKPPRSYPNPSGYSSVGMMREEKSANYKK